MKSFPASAKGRERRGRSSPVSSLHPQAQKDTRAWAALVFTVGAREGLQQGWPGPCWREATSKEASPRGFPATSYEQNMLELSWHQLHLHPRSDKPPQKRGRSTSKGATGEMRRQLHHWSNPREPKIKSDTLQVGIYVHNLGGKPKQKLNV